jgi:2-dehydropantoate 2-reductase
MRVAVIGAGGIGAPLGASLAKAGHEVHFVARGAHLAAMRQDGLRIVGDRGETLVRPALATDRPGEIGPVDLVLFAVKLWDVETAGAAIRPLIGAQTLVVPLQNGVDASERLDPILGAMNVLGGVGLVTGSIVAPGIVRQSGTHHRVTFGERAGGTSARCERLRDSLAGAGIDAVLSADIQAVRWEKFVALAPSSAACAAARTSIGPLRADPEGWALIEGGMREVVAVGRAVGVALADSVVDTWRNFLMGVPENWTPSMAVDIVAGRRLELPWLAGQVVALGHLHHVATPVHASLNAVLRPHAAGTA